MGCWGMGDETLGVLEGAEAVVAAGRHVRVDGDAVQAVVEGALAGSEGLPRFRAPRWRDGHNFPGPGGVPSVNFLLAQDAVNFCFWGDPPWRVTYRGRVHSGYRGLVAALRRALEVGCPLDDAAYLAHLSADDLEFILRGEGRLPLLRERLENLREVGRVLQERYGGRGERLVEAAGGSAVALVRLLAAEFRSFDDRARYDGLEVPFYKRAQLCVADLYGAYGGQGLGSFGDLDRLTAFADYELPRVLRHLGILRYSPELAAAVDGRRLLPAGSPEEVEIRAATVVAVERLRRALAECGMHLRAFEVDWILWDWCQEHPPAAPAHRTLTIYY